MDPSSLNDSFVDCDLKSHRVRRIMDKIDLCEQSNNADKY